MKKVIISVILAIVLITPILSVNVCAEDIAINVLVLVEPVLEYDGVINGFSDGLLRVVKDGKNGFIDRMGKLIIPCEYNALSFSEGLAVVHETNEDGSEKWGFIDTSGKIVIPLKYNWVSSFNNGRAVFEENKKYGLLDKEGNVAVPATYLSMRCKYDGSWAVYKDGKWGIIDKNGDFVLPLEYEWIYSFGEGMAVTQKDDKYGFINEKGEWIIPAIYNNAASFHEGLAWVLENDEGRLIEKFIDKTGKVVLDLDDYDYKSAANYFSDGLCLVHKEKKFGFIDKTGNIIIPMVYDILDDNPYSFDAPDSFHDGRAIVKKDGKYGIIDTKGKEVVPVIYDYIRYFLTNFNNDSIYNGYVAAEKDGKWGILNYRTGIEIVPPAYDFIDYNAFGEDGLVVVEKDGKYGILQIVETKPNKSGYVLTATPAKSTVLIDGKETVFNAYEIDGENYFKLRDIAYTLSGSAKQFEVIWDSAKNAINLTSGKAYTPVGGEMSDRRTEKKTPVLSKAKIYLDGKEVMLTAYQIEGNNYFKLSEIGQAFDFGVNWNDANNTVVIATSKGYTAKDDNNAAPSEAIYKYRAEGESIPFDIIKLIDSIPLHNSMEQILEYDPHAYFLGENEVGVKSVISENRTLCGIEGVVVYSGGVRGGSFVNFHFIVPNVTFRQYEELTIQMQAYTSTTFEHEFHYGKFADVFGVYDANCEDMVFEDPNMFVCTQVAAINAETEQPYYLQMVFVGEKSSLKFWESSNAPWQGEKIYNQVEVCIFYPILD